MDILFPKGKYVLAVSGGVDSMVLLDLLSKEPAVELVVAHFDHGTRIDSARDEELVRKQAAELNLQFEAGYGRLGEAASEEAARTARYEFLEAVKESHKAGKIITAHHQDDLIETALINILRGTNRLGLSTMADNPNVLRPLLSVPKSEIIKYATRNGLSWREDSTNQNTEYLRNYLRLKVLPKMNKKQRESLIDNIDKIAKLNREINDEIATLSHNTAGNVLDRIEFSTLPNVVANELMAAELRNLGVVDIDSKTIKRLNLAIRTSRPYSTHKIKQRYTMRLTADKASFCNSLA